MASPDHAISVLRRYGVDAQALETGCPRSAMPLLFMVLDHTNRGRYGVHVLCSDGDDGNNEMRRITLSGFLWSLAIMTKPVVLYLPLALAWFWREDRKKMAVFLVSAYLLPLAWSARNYKAIRQFTFTTQSSSQLKDYLAGGVATLNSHKKYANTLFTSNSEAILYLIRHPLLDLRFFVNNTIKMFGLTEFETLLELRGVDRSGIPLNESGRLSGAGTLATLNRWPVLVLPFCWFTIYLLAVYWMFFNSLWVGDRKQYVIYTVIAWLWILGAMAFGAPRYRLPIIPLMALAIVRRRN